MSLSSNSRRSIVALLAVSISLTALVSPASAQNVPNAGTTTPASTAYAQYLNLANLSLNDFRHLAVRSNIMVSAQTPAFGLSDVSLTNLFSNLPDYWDLSAVRYYRIRNCDGSYNQIFTNFLGMMGSSKFGASGSTIFGPTASSDPSYAFASSAGNPPTTTLCANTPVPPFLYPTWYNSAAAPATSSFSTSLVPYRTSVSTVGAPGSQYANDGIMLMSLRRSGDLSQPLTVSYTLGGTAVRGVDYDVSVNGFGQGPITPTTLTIPAGYSEINLVFNAFTNLNDHPEKTVSLAVANTGNAVNNGLFAETTIIALSLPDTTLSTEGFSIIEPGTFQNAFAFTRSGGDISKPLVLNLAISGTAVNGTDYARISNVLTIPAGPTRATLPIVAPIPSGNTAKSATSVGVSIASSTDGSYRVVPDQPNLVFQIPAYTPTVVSVNYGPQGATLAPGSPTNFVVSRSGDTSKDLNVPYNLGGTAVNGTDYVFSDLAPISISRFRNGAERLLSFSIFNKRSFSLGARSESSHILHQSQ